MFLDDASSGSAAESKEEKEANHFAADVLIPPTDRKRLGQVELTVAGVCKFAKEVNIHPGIVVGCLQHVGLLAWSSPLNQLKDRYQISPKIAAK